MSSGVNFVHCNKCGVLAASESQLQAAIRFNISACGHIFCNQCVSYSCLQRRCVICGRSPFFTNVIDESLPPEMKKFFAPPQILLMRGFHLVQKVLEFQREQVKIIRKLLSEKVEKVQKLKLANKQGNAREAELKRQIEVLKQDLDTTQRMLGADMIAQCLKRVGCDEILATSGHPGQRTAGRMAVNLPDQVKPAKDDKLNASCDSDVSNGSFCSIAPINFNESFGADLFCNTTDNTAPRNATMGTERRKFSAGNRCDASAKGSVEGFADRDMGGVEDKQLLPGSAAHAVTKHALLLQSTEDPYMSLKLASIHQTVGHGSHKRLHSKERTTGQHQLSDARLGRFLQQPVPYPAVPIPSKRNIMNGMHIRAVLNNTIDSGEMQANTIRF